MKWNTMTALLLAGLIGFAQSAGAAPKTVRVTELTPKVWHDFERGAEPELIVEFRQGDRLPVSFQAEGDFIESTESRTSYVVVKRGFWLKAEHDQIGISLDGASYKPFNQIVSGSFTAGATSGPSGSGVANVISLLLKAYLK